MVETNRQARPTIVIGVGGTGSWVLSWLKKDLVETYEDLSQVPVKLLLLDVADNLAQVGQAGNTQAVNRSQGNVVRGQYSKYLILDDNEEFIQLPTDRSRQTTLGIRDGVLDGKLPHLDWLAADYFQLPAWDLTDGAGQFRQMGRISLLKGLHLNQASDSVYSKLQNMVNELTNRVGIRDDPFIDVHITGSFMGGSGSGIFMDTAWLVRKIIPANVKVFVSGFFVLPGALNRSPDDAQRAKAFTAWRELNRMMTIEEKVSEFRVQWGPNPSVIYDVKVPAYDHVYLVDSMAPGSTKATESVFPVIADAISFYIDAESGQEYIQHIRSNLGPVRNSVDFRNKPTYSTLFVRSWKLPVYHRLNVARHNFAIEYLRRLLDVQVQQVAGIGTSKQDTNYSLPSKPEYRQKSLDIFNATMVHTGLTQFIQHQTEIATIPSVQVSGHVQRYADFATDLLSMYTMMPDTDEGKFVADELSEYVNFVIPQLPDSNSNSEFNSFILQGQQNLYGIHGAGGRYSVYFGDFVTEAAKGRLFEKLELVHDFHMRVFRNRVKAWINQQLNLPSDGQYSGLACVKDALLQLVQHLKFNRDFFANVRTALPNIPNKTLETVNALNEALGVTANDSFIETGKNVAGLPGSGKGRTNAWLQHEVEYLQLQRNARAVEAMLFTLNQMLEFTEQIALYHIGVMERFLVTGDDASAGRGLYQELTESLKDEEDRHERDRNLGAVTQMLEDNKSIPPVNIAEVEKLVKQTRWSIDDNLTLKLEINPYEDVTAKPIVIQADLNDPAAARKLVNVVINQIARIKVRDQVSRKAIESVDLSKLFTEIDELTNTTLFVASPDTPPNREARTFYLRCDAGAKATEVQDRMGKVNIPRQRPNSISHVGSSNSNKIVLFSARELLLPTNFHEWAMCKDSYQTMVRGDAGRGIEADLDRIRYDHLFKAEQNALWLEDRFFQADTQGRFPVLNQRLVHLMENGERLNQFLRLWAFGWVTDRHSSGVQQTWTIRYEEDGQVESIDLCPKKDMDMVAVMARYVIYGRDKNNRDLPFKAIDPASDGFFEQQLQSKKSSNQLVEVFKFEADMAELCFKTVARRLERHDRIDTKQMKVDLDKATQGVTRPPQYLLPTEAEVSDEDDEDGDSDAKPKYRRSLAEEAAYDFTRIISGGDVLVTNQEAHLQLLEVVLYHLYNVLRDEVKEYRETKSW